MILNKLKSSILKIQAYYIALLFYIDQSNKSITSNQNRLIVMTDFIHHFFKRASLLRDGYAYKTFLILKI